jgi:hypothetical protein
MAFSQQPYLVVGYVSVGGNKSVDAWGAGAKNLER